jgi:hypothetical protein
MVVCLGVCECDRSHDSMSLLEERGWALDVAGAAYCFYLSYLISTYLLVYMSLPVRVLDYDGIFTPGGSGGFAPRWAAGVNQSLLCRGCVVMRSAWQALRLACSPAADPYNLAPSACAPKGAGWLREQSCNRITMASDATGS